MCRAAQHHHASIVCQRIEQTGDEQEVSDVVGKKLELVTERAFERRQGHDPGVADHTVELDARFFTAWTQARTDDGSASSQASGTKSPASPELATRAFSSVRAAASTRAPRLASTRTVSRPIPEFDPVTRMRAATQVQPLGDLLCRRSVTEAALSLPLTSATSDIFSSATFLRLDAGASREVTHRACELKA